MDPEDDPRTMESTFSTPGLLRRCGIILGVFTLTLAAILFLPAGRLDWWMAWGYIGIFVIGAIIATPILMRVNPELVEERLRLRKRAGQPADIAIAFVMAGFWVVGLVASGVDLRLGWSPPLSPAVQFVAFAVVSVGYLLAVWAMAANKFFAWFVRVQKDRGHEVVAAGPYRFVRHPGYVGGLLMFIATPLTLGSIWAFIPMGLAMCTLVLRTALEDRTLQADLDGYRDYVRRVRYRLLPGIW